VSAYTKVRKPVFCGLDYEGLGVPFLEVIVFHDVR